ncbi:uncharacterized protein LOC123520531 [Portunus trituberculatus]|uniref:uncharacterized protein LOC123520531 n=1 Tax=Portunus trituberculatus TaxID=210409 RepID=UPI001E1CDF3F|nr:uncharacterized protein LOC123520531 [Portunus trituberculatus]XP_045138798.1 uncharacterized protein LOC123520531 [Portunus trituberculatus]
MGKAGRVMDKDKTELAKDEKAGKKESLKESFRRFIKDLTTPRLLLYKIIYFLYLAAIVILWPQFTVHQAALGLSVAHTGIFSTVESAFNVFTPFLAGFVADKIGNYKIILVLSSVLTSVLAFLHTLVPSAMVPFAANTTDITNITDALTTTATAAPANTTSSPALDVDPELLTITFWTYLAVRTAHGALHVISYTLFDAAVMAEVQEKGTDYGFQRAWGTLAATAASFLSGYLVQTTEGYSVIFYVSTALQLFSAGLMIFLSLDFKPPSTGLTRLILRLFANTEVILFFIAILAAGVFFGFLETFMYRYIFSLGGDNKLLGLTVTVGTPFELIFNLLASFLVPYTGHAAIIMFGLVGHAIRLLGFSYLENPWWVLGLEVLESISNGLTFTVSMMYCTVLFSLETIVSFRGLFVVVYFGVGKSIGAASGSWLQDVFGERGSFRVLSWVAFASAFLYAAAFYGHKRWRMWRGKQRRLQTLWYLTARCQQYHVQTCKK